MTKKARKSFQGRNVKGFGLITFNNQVLWALLASARLFNGLCLVVGQLPARVMRVLGHAFPTKFSHGMAEVQEREQINALSLPETKTQNQHNVASATFYWSKQVTRTSKIQGLGKQILSFNGKNYKVTLQRDNNSLDSGEL